MIETFVKLGTALAAVIGALFLIFMHGRTSRRLDRARRNLEASRTRLDSIRTVRKLEGQADTQDDTALVDRLSGRR